MHLKRNRRLAGIFIVLGVLSVATPASADIYTAWVGKEHPNKKNFYSRFYSGVASTSAEAKARALNVCGTSCKVLNVKKGCSSFRLKNSGKVLRPKGC